MISCRTIGSYMGALRRLRSNQTCQQPKTLRSAEPLPIIRQYQTRFKPMTIRVDSEPAEYRELAKVHGVAAHTHALWLVNCCAVLIATSSLVG